MSVTIRLDDKADELLTRVCVRRGVTPYVQSVLDRNWELWNGALTALKSNTWTNAELVAACIALNGFRFDLSDGALNFTVAAYLDRAGHKRATDFDDEKSLSLAYNLSVLAVEWWLGNQSLKRELESRGSIRVGVVNAPPA